MAAPASLLRWSVALLLACSMGAGLVPAPAHAQPKAKPYRVLLVKSYGANFAPWHVVASSFRASLVKAVDRPVEFYETSVEFARTGNDEAGAPMADYVHALFSDRPPDLMLPLGRPAARFALEHRAALFPEVPVLITGMLETAADDLELGPRDGLLTMRPGKNQFVETVNRPGLLRDVLVVLGSAPHERYFGEKVERDMAPVVPEGRVQHTSGMSLPAILERIRNLPPRSLVVFGTLSVDADGVQYEFDDALDKVLEVSPVPVMGGYDYQLGKGVLGVIPLPARELGHQAGLEAARLLRGQAPRKLPPVASGPLQFDARVLDRFNIPELLLPSSVEIHFREPSLWQRVRPYALVGLLVLGGQSVLIVLLMRSQKRQARAEAANRKLAEQVLRVQEEERARIARELHDDLSQRVAWLSMMTGRSQLSDEDRAAADRELKQLGKDLSQVAYSLHPATLEKLGLLAAVRAECHRFGEAAGIAAVVESGPLPSALPAPVSLCAYRVVQESLRNARRHAGAKQVRVFLGEQEKGLQVAIRDDGAGFVPRADGPGLGLRSMRERVRALGGELDVESTPGEGTEVVAWIPWDAQDRKEATA
ncbi:MAG: Oxygen sensor histidine kinase NreB [Pseudomonadota bacterium]|jgi:signal transduction histidine kinase